MRWNDISQMTDSRRVCRRVNLEKELNNEELLTKIHQHARRIIGIGLDQPISSDILIEKLGEVVFEYAGREIDSNKILALLGRGQDKRKACIIIGRTVVCLLASYGLISEGPRL